MKAIELVEGTKERERNKRKEWELGMGNYVVYDYGLYAIRQKVAWSKWRS